MATTDEDRREPHTSGVDAAQFEKGESEISRDFRPITISQPGRQVTMAADPPRV